MQSERWRTCTDIFHAALERTPNERSAFVNESCAGDDGLRAQVELLLRYHDEAGDFIDSPAFADAPELLAADPDALVGKNLGHYRIEGVLGAGGMGVVYLACDELLGRKVGLKLLPRALVTDEAQLERLKFEARTASALNHPNIVTVHEIGQVESIHYIAIEFIEGITLRERINRGPVPTAETLEIMTQVASALCVAHRAGIVHRDIKPENIMIRPDGYVKVLDFGIAKSTQGGTLAEAAAVVGKTKTQLGVIMGTTRYMSPEQARGETVDARSDIWSLGVVLYEMLTGSAPFDGETLGKVRDALLCDEPQPLEEHEQDIPLSLQETVEKCLRKDPRERFQTSEELLGALRSSRDGDQAKVRRNWIFAGIGLALLLAGIAYLFASRFERSSKRASDITLGRPAGLAVSAKGIVYVADFAQHAIRQIAPGGTLTNLAGATGITGSADGVGTGARFSHPGDVAIGRDENIYVADTNNHLIRKITPAGAVSTFAGRAGEAGSEDGTGTAARFRFPTSVALDRTGNVYVADFSNHTIRKITPDGTVSTLAGSAGEPGSADGARTAAHFNQIHGVAVDGTGNIYAADFGNHTIRKVSPDGIVSTLAGLAENPGSTDGVGRAARFSAPYDVAVDDSGNVYVADTSNHTLRKITPAGVVSTPAGIAANVGSADGIASEARFSVPAALTLDQAGNVYVADFGNQAIRKVTPDAVVSTLSVRTAPPNEAPEKSIAVLPFVDLSQAKDQEYMCDGMSEELLDSLSRIEGLRVVARTSSFSFKGKAMPVADIAQKLGVQNILEGSLRRDGNRIRITAQLINARDGFHLWSETFERELSGVFAVQDEITSAIVEKLKATLALASPRRVSENAEAHELYLRGLYFSNKSSEEDLRNALALFQQALEKDPKFARAWTGIAKVWLWLADEYVTPLEGYAAMEAAASKALALNPNDTEARCYLGEAKWFLNWDPVTAETEVARALAIEPNSASAHMLLALLQPDRGDCDAGVDHIRAAEQLDPLSPVITNRKRSLMIRCHRLDEALAAAQRTIELDPNFIYRESPLAGVYREQGRLDEALVLYLKAAEIRHRPSAGLAIVYADLGREAEARDVLRQLLERRKSRYMRADAIAAVYAALGEREETFAWLETAYREHSSSLPNVPFLSEFRPFLSDPRFADLIRRMGFDPEVILRQEKSS